ncbi:hypothetical protein BDN70DRAFT_871410 [Pholiota conissans]|uniref:Uncharacterized protein n=1 Tax=Pholiota conissans TaxID=109636 RepID=A0A9P5ZDD1_9AGAR|nr:hypothetical protein BDN70DRAFT_871410 [Pholiota conissans]
MKHISLSLLTTLLPAVLALHVRPSFDFVLQDEASFNKPEIKVGVQLGVMSRCPDALLCESTFNEVLDKVMDKVDLSLVYVAKIDNSEPDFGVSCMHGPDECAGNVQQLCVHRYAPFNNFWEFVKCQNYQGRDKIGTPEVALQCAKTAGIDWEVSGAGQCAGLDGSGKASEGVAMLQESTRLGHALGIQKSCTVLISGRPICVHDGTWKECENGHTPNDFVHQIEEEYDQLNRD